MAKDEKDEQDPKPDQAQDNNSPAEGEERTPRGADEKGTSSFSEEDRTPVEEMTTLGQCRYCENDAVRMAPHKDGSGWIAICDEHETEARDDDFEPEKEKDPSAS